MKLPAGVRARYYCRLVVEFTRIGWLFALYLALVFTVSDSVRPVVIIAYMLITLADAIFLRHLRTLVYDVCLLGTKYWWSGAAVLCWWQALRWHCTRLRLLDTVTLGSQTLVLKTSFRQGVNGRIIVLSCRPAEADVDLVGFGFSAGEALADLRLAYQELLNFCDT